MKQFALKTTPAWIKAARESTTLPLDIHIAFNDCETAHEMLGELETSRKMLDRLAKYAADIAVVGTEMVLSGRGNPNAVQSDEARDHPVQGENLPGEGA